MNTPDFDPVLGEVRRQVDSGLRPSIQIAIAWKGRKVVDFAYGEEATPESLYLLWSSTKPFVALTLLQLIDEGRANLDDRVGTYLPEFATRGKEKATLAHVLSHRGGFPDNTPEARRAIISRVQDFDATLQWVCNMPTAWPPGTDRGYHPMSGWIVLAELIRRLDDRPVAESVHGRVLEPAGIDPAAFSLGEPERLRHAPMRIQTQETQGAPRQAEADFWNARRTQSALIPGAGGISSAREVLKFYRALLRGGQGPNGRLLSESMLRQATYPHVVGIPDRTFLRDIPWGLGFHLKHVRPSLDDCGRTASPGTFGHAGHFLVNTAWADPGKDLAVCILSNGLTEPRSGIRAVARLSQAVHDAIDALDAD